MVTNFLLKYVMLPNLDESRAIINEKLFHVQNLDECRVFKIQYTPLCHQVSMC